MNDTLLQKHPCLATGTTILTQTVRNCLRTVGLYARWPIVCVRLIASHCRALREWATEHVHWGRNEWQNILFSDESFFSLHPDNRSIFIWREHTWNNSAFMYKSVRFGGGGMMVSAGISIDGYTDLLIIWNGVLTGCRFRVEILSPIVVLYAAAIGDDFILINDSCRPHWANFVNDFLLEEGITRRELPACAPDMNPKEHVWDILGRRVAGRLPSTQTLQGLERAILEEWDSIP